MHLMLRKNCEQTYLQELPLEYKGAGKPVITHYYMIDLENVGIKALRGIDLTEENAEVVIFISNAAHIATTELQDDICTAKARVKTFFCGATCKNGMDFEIAAFFGEILKREDTERISIISNDKGYQALTDYAMRVRKSVSVYLAPSVMEAYAAASAGYSYKEYEMRKDNAVDFKQLMQALESQ